MTDEELKKQAERYAFDHGTAHGNRDMPAWHYSIQDYIAGHRSRDAELHGWMQDYAYLNSSYTWALEEARKFRDDNARLRAALELIRDCAENHSGWWSMNISRDALQPQGESYPPGINHPNLDRNEPHRLENGTPYLEDKKE